MSADPLSAFSDFTAAVGERLEAGAKTYGFCAVRLEGDVVTVVDLAELRPARKPPVSAKLSPHPKG